MTGAKPSRIVNEAAAWVVRLEGKTWSEGEMRAFRRWLGRSPAHRPTFLEVARTWHHYDLLERIEAFPLAANDERIIAPDRRLVLAGVAALALAAGGVGYVAFAPPEAQAYSTSIGERRDARLSDGTQVTMNAATQIEARIDAHGRRARLMAGEALFEVAPGAVHVFVIDTGAGLIELSEGAILIKRLPHGVRATLISGVATTRGQGLFARGSTTQAAAPTEILFQSDDVRIAPADAPLLVRRTRWREGWLAFDGETLAEAAADVTAQTGVSFAFTDPAIAEMRIGGLVRADDLDAFLLLLHENLGLMAVRRGDATIELSTSATL